MSSPAGLGNTRAAALASSAAANCAAAARTAGDICAGGASVRTSISGGADCGALVPGGKSAGAAALGAGFPATAGSLYARGSGRSDKLMGNGAAPGGAGIVGLGPSSAIGYAPRGSRTASGLAGGSGSATVTPSRSIAPGGRGVTCETLRIPSSVLSSRRSRYTGAAPGAAVTGFGAALGSFVGAGSSARSRGKGMWLAATAAALRFTL